MITRRKQTRVSSQCRVHIQSLASHTQTHVHIQWREFSGTSIIKHPFLSTFNRFHQKRLISIFFFFNCFLCFHIHNFCCSVELKKSCQTNFKEKKFSLGNMSCYSKGFIQTERIRGVFSLHDDNGLLRHSPPSSCSPLPLILFCFIKLMFCFKAQIQPSRLEYGPHG